MNINYTQRELTQKNRTVADAVRIAKHRLKSDSIDLRPIRNMNMDDALTVKEANDLADEIVSYNYCWN